MKAYDAMLYQAQRPREAVSDGKQWLRDVVDDADHEIRLMNAVQVVSLVDRMYDGGWTQFLRDGFNEKAPRVAATGLEG